MQRQFSRFARVWRRALDRLRGALQAPGFGLACALGACAVTLSPPLAARAYEEQASLDLALGYAGIVKAETLRPQLASVDVGAALGISDFLVLRGALGYGLLLERRQKTQHAGRARIELAYLVDILKWVPFFGLGVGVWGVGGDGGKLAFRPAGHGVVGLDYLIARGFTLGCDVRIGMLLESRSLVSWTEGQLRSSFVFDLF